MSDDLKIARLAWAARISGLEVYTLNDLIRRDKKMRATWGARKVAGRWYISRAAFLAWLTPASKTRAAPEAQKAGEPRRAPCGGGRSGRR